MSEFLKADFMVDIEGMWYLIPEHLKEEFIKDTDEGSPYFVEDPEIMHDKWYPYCVVWGNFRDLKNNPFDVYIKMK